MARQTISSHARSRIKPGCIALIVFSSLLWNVGLATVSLAQHASETKYYLRNPAGHGSTVVFEFNGYLWRKEGVGAARRVTKGNAQESAPAVSPDGSLVAYVALMESSHEVFVASLASGETTRLTFDGGFDMKVQGWLGSTEILYSTTVKSGKRGPLLFALDIRTKRSHAIPLLEASEGCVLGDHFVYVKNQELVDSNRLYSGGYAQKIITISYGVLFSASHDELHVKNPSLPLTDSYAGISRNPLCIGDRVFFLSDRDGRFNVWSMKPNGRDLVQHTFEADYDIRSMTTSDGSFIYYQRAGEIFRLDPSGGLGERVVINIPAARIAETERFIFDPADATDFAVSDDGKRVALVIRGKLWAVELATGAATCAECNSDRRVKSPVLTSDGGTIFALHDASGEYDMYAYDLSGGSVRRVAHEIKDPIFDFSVSPNGQNILVRSVPGGLYHVDAASGATKRIEVSSRTRPNDITWSSNNRFAAFVSYTRNGLGRITAYDSACDSVTYLTSGRHHVATPVFSEDNRDIYFTMKKNFRSSVDDTWGPTNYWPSFDNKSLIHAVDISALSERPDTEPSVVLNSSAVKKSQAKCSEGGTGRGRSRHDRLLVRELPLVAGNYDSLLLIGGRLHIFSKRAARDKWGQIAAFSRDLHGRRSAPQIVFNERIYGYAVSATGRAIVVRTASGLYLSSIAASGDFGLPTPLRSVGGLEVEINLAKEREQIFNELWRMHRDYFWDPNMAGVDWEREREKYRAFLPRVSNRTEFGEVVAYMVSELGAGHTSFGVPAPDAQGRQGVARLGGEFSEEDGLRVDKIFDGDLDVDEERSPLSTTAPPLDVGDHIKHVDGVAVTSRLMLDQMLYGRVGQTVILGVAKSDGRVLENRVVPISASHETWLRNKTWAADNSALVDELSGRTVGYIHLQSAYESDFSSFIRQYAYIHQREALIIDLRGNNGGNIDPWLLHFLQRRTWLHIADRYDSMALRHPHESFDGKLIVLIDGDTYSDGELIAEGVRQLDLGVLIGTKTSGAGKWVNDDKMLIDGSRVRIPEAGSYFVEDGKARWIIEGRGVEPDIHVENDPYLSYLGFDAQLRAAVDYAMRAQGK